MATEIFHEFEADAPVTLIPVGGGRLELYAGGQKLFDRKAEGGIYPEMKRMREIKRQVQELVNAAK